MKIHLKIFVIAIFVSLNIISTLKVSAIIKPIEDLPKIDSAIVVDTSFTFRSKNDTLSKQHRSIFFYDKFGSVVDQHYQGWDAEKNDYINSERWPREYDNKRRPTVDYSYGFKNGDWYPKEKSFYLYDEKDNLSEEKAFFWNGNEWMNFNLSKYKYDNNNNQIEMIYQYWKGNSWANVNKRDFQYYEDNRLKQELLSTVSEENWISNQKWNWEYTDQINTVISQKWVSDAWESYDKTIYKYNPKKKLVERVDYLWNGADWQYSVKKSYKYNDFDLRIEEITETWNKTKNSFDSTEKRIYTYNTNNKVIQEDRYYFINNNFSKYYIVINKYKQIITDNNCILENGITEDISIFPNPSNGNISIESKNYLINYISIFDLSGKIILNKQFNGNLNMDLEKLNNGDYFIQILTDKGIITKNISILK